MSQNRLYQLIANHKPEFMNKRDISFKVSTQYGIRYAMYSPSQPDNIIMADLNNEYHLRSDHISFYESIDVKNPYLSEYHYTAILIDDDKQQYQLHVYFNQKDQLTTSPLLKKIDDNNSRIIENVSPELSQQCIALAQARCGDSLRNLRNHHSTLIADLHKNYLQAETKLCELSLDLNDNQDKYLAQLEITIEKLEKLAMYHENDFYHATLRRFKMIKQYILTPAANPLSSSGEIPAKNKFDSSSSNAHNPNNKNKAVSSPKPAKPIINKIAAQWQEFKKNDKKHENELKKIQLFSNLYSDINEILLLSDNVYYFLDRDDLKTAQRLQIELTHQGESLLQAALFSKNFQAAKLLRNLAPLLSDKMVKIAIINNNPELLKFMLEHTFVPIETLIIKDELTPIAFCLNNCSEKNKMIEVFEILLANGASILSPAKDGLPVAHHIIQQIETHPLAPLLDGLMKKPSFWRQLATSLKNYLANSNNVNQNLHIELENAYKFYLNHADKLAENKSNQYLLSKFHILSNLNQSSSSMLKAEIDKIVNHPDIARFKIELESLIENHYKVCADKKIKPLVIVYDLLTLLNNDIRDIDHKYDFELKVTIVFYLYYLRILLMKNIAELTDLPVPAKHKNRSITAKNIKSFQKSLKDTSEILGEYNILTNIYHSIATLSKDAAKCNLLIEELERLKNILDLAIEENEDNKNNVTNKSI